MFFVHCSVFSFLLLRFYHEWNMHSLSWAFSFICLPCYWCERYHFLLTALEGAIKREYLDSNYETTCELLGLFSASGCHTNDSIDGERMHVLPWVPYTSATVALRLFQLDACIFYTSQQKLESEKDKKIGIVMVSILFLLWLWTVVKMLKRFEENKQI